MNLNLKKTAKYTVITIVISLILFIILVIIAFENFGREYEVVSFHNYNDGYNYKLVLEESSLTPSVYFLTKENSFEKINLSKVIDDRSRNFIHIMAIDRIEVSSQYILLIANRTDKVDTMKFELSP